MVAQTRRELDVLAQATASAAPAKARVRAATTESAPVRWLLIALGLGFILLVLVLPLVSVFLEAFRSGVDAFIGAIKSDDTLAAVRLTLLVAGISVPLNVVFG